MIRRKAIMICAIPLMALIAGVILHRLVRGMDREAIPTIAVAFFCIALAIVFVAVFSKAYTNWRD